MPYRRENFNHKLFSFSFVMHGSELACIVVDYMLA
jgi:hypothetical protein